MGRRVVLIDAFRRAMEQLGVTGKVFATDVTPVSSAMQVADRGFIVPRAGNIDYIPTIRDIVKENGSAAFSGGFIQD